MADIDRKFAIWLLFLTAFFLYVLAFATTSWRIEDTIHEGLWQRCDCPGSFHTPAWLKASQAMFTIGFTFLALTFTVACYHNFRDQRRTSFTEGLILVLSFIGVFFMFLGLVIYGAKTKKPSWSYAMAAIGSFCTLVGSFVVCTDRD